MGPKSGIADVLILSVLAATLIGAGGLRLRQLLQEEACTDLSIKVTMSCRDPNAGSPPLLANAR